MIWFRTAATFLPSLLPMLAFYCLGPVLEVFPLFTIFVLLLTLLPLIVQLFRWGYRRSRQGPSGAVMPPHPFGLVLPLGLPLVVPLWPVGEWAARQIPALCELSASERVPAGRTESPSRTARFIVGVRGWGNPRSFGFTGGNIIYATRDRRFDDLYFDLPRWRGHWTNSYTTHFPLTREVVGEYVRRSDDFPPEEAEAIINELWDALHRYAEKRNLPPMVDHHPTGEGPRIVSYVPPPTIYLSSCTLALLPLAVGSWVLARRYHRRVLQIEGERLPDGTQ